MMDQEIKEIIKQNQETLESLDERVSKIQSKMRWQTVGNVIKTIFILGPVIIGIIYLSPYVKKYIKVFEPVLETLRLSPENSIIDLGNTSGPVNEIDAIQQLCDPRSQQQVLEKLCK